MFGQMLRKEFKYILDKPLYWIFIIVAVVFITFQLEENDIKEKLKKPDETKDNFGIVYSAKPEDIMPYMLFGLVTETYENTYATYPTGFFKAVKLSEADHKRAVEIVETLSGKSIDELINYSVDNYRSVSIAISPEITYKEFVAYMEEMCDMIGRGSSYEIYEGLSVPVRASYERALLDYNSLIKDGNVTDALMRVFCDYAGIILGFMCIFITVLVWTRDGEHDIREVIYTKKIEEYKLLLAKYIAITAAIFVPMLLLSGALELRCILYARSLQITVNALAFLKYSISWLLPEILFICAVTMVITELYGKVISMIIMNVAIMGNLLGAKSLTGDFGIKLIIRFNQLGMQDTFVAQQATYYLNRGLYLVLALVAVGIWILVFRYKRSNSIVRRTCDVE